MRGLKVALVGGGVSVNLQDGYALRLFLVRDGVERQDARLETHRGFDFFFQEGVVFLQTGLIHHNLREANQISRRLLRFLLLDDFQSLDSCREADVREGLDDGGGNCFGRIAGREVALIMRVELTLGLEGREDAIAQQFARLEV